MKTSTNPIDNIVDQINERGLMLFENVSRMPTYEKPFVSSFMVVCVNHTGWVKCIYDMKPIEFQPHDLAIIPPGHILVTKETSDDYTASLLVISPRFLKKLANKHPESYKYHYSNSAFHMKDEQYDGIIGYFKMVRAVSQVNGPEREELIANQMEVGTRLIGIYHRESGLIRIHQTTIDQELIIRFQNALLEHFRESREVQFYADLLCLSPKYFGSIIKKQTGMAAGEWIAQYVIVQAKTMLRYRKDLNIQEISNYLGFPDPTAFTRYFKANAGLSPKEFRTEQ